MRGVDWPQCVSPQPWREIDAHDKVHIKSRIKNMQTDRQTDRNTHRTIGTHVNIKRKAEKREKRKKTVAPSLPVKQEMAGGNHAYALNNAKNKTNSSCAKKLTCHSFSAAVLTRMWCTVSLHKSMPRIVRAHSSMIALVRVYAIHTLA